VTSDADCAAAIDGVRARFGGIDVLVSNAGVTLLSPVAALPLDELRDVLDVNLLGPLRLLKLVLPEMLDRRSGQIVVITSVAAARGLPGLGGYAATKAALHTLIDALRAEVDGRGVDVLEVAPGKTTTDILASSRGPGAGHRPLDRLQPTMTAEFVAERVARASERGTRRLTLGLGARLIALAERVSPALTDRLAARAMSR
jgi:NAD(P)-dependent dehydrogenase (short-subunit alcohol dehydrogenase family)